VKYEIENILMKYASKSILTMTDITTKARK